MRHHMTGSGPVAFTDEEEAEADQREAAYQNRLHNLAIDAQIAALEIPFTDAQMAFLESVLPDGAGKAEIQDKIRMADALGGSKR